MRGAFIEQWTEPLEQSRWSPSRATKDKDEHGEVRPPFRRVPSLLLASFLTYEPRKQVFSYVGKWSVEEPEVYPGLQNDLGLVLSTKAAHHAISTPLEEVLDPKGKPLVLSYEVKLQKGLDCGGAYLKLLSESSQVRPPHSSGLTASPPGRGD